MWDLYAHKNSILIFILELDRSGITFISHFASHYMFCLVKSESTLQSDVKLFQSNRTLIKLFILL